MKITYKKYLGFCVFLAIFLLAGHVQAASLRLDGPKQPVLVNQDFRVDLILDPEGQNLNAVGGRIIWPADFEVRAVSDADSIIGLWTERGHYDGQEIIFSGIMPGGYIGSYSPTKQGPQPGIVISIVGRAKKIGNQAIRFSELEVYPNDGSGEAIIVNKPQLIIGAYGDTAPAPGQLPLIANDTIAPQELTASIERDETVADNKWFVVFSARDQESGIKEFYIQESSSATPNADWLPVGSPFVLTDQTRKSFVHIKAVDLNNNQAVITLTPETNKVPLVENKINVKQIVFFVIMILLIIVVVVIINKKRRQ